MAERESLKTLQIELCLSKYSYKKSLLRVENNRQINVPYYHDRFDMQSFANIQTMISNDPQVQNKDSILKKLKTISEKVFSESSSRKSFPFIIITSTPCTQDK